MMFKSVFATKPALALVAILALGSLSLATDAFAAHGGGGGGGGGGGHGGGGGGGFHGGGGGGFRAGGGGGGHIGGGHTVAAPVAPGHFAPAHVGGGRTVVAPGQFAPRHIVVGHGPGAHVAAGHRDRAHFPFGHPPHFWHGRCRGYGVGPCWSWTPRRDWVRPAGL